EIDETARLIRPVAQPQTHGSAIHEQHIAQDSWRGGGLVPAGDALGIDGPVVAAQCGAVDLQADDGPDQLDVQLLRDGVRGVLERALPALALGIAPLADPAVFRTATA